MQNASLKSNRSFCCLPQHRRGNLICDFLHLWMLVAFNSLAAEFLRVCQSRCPLPPFSINSCAWDHPRGWWSGIDLWHPNPLPTYSAMARTLTCCKILQEKVNGNGIKVTCVVLGTCIDPGRINSGAIKERILFHASKQICNSVRVVEIHFEDEH